MKSFMIKWVKERLIQRRTKKREKVPWSHDFTHFLVGTDDDQGLAGVELPCRPIYSFWKYGYKLHVGG